MIIKKFDETNFKSICDQLSNLDKDLAYVVHTYGYPPISKRPNTFKTLVHIILEQQVSLASALSALNKMQEKVSKVEPENLLMLTDEEFKACYFSRQKTSYVRHLAHALLKNDINLDELSELPDENVRLKLIQLKGIGNWTVDVYLMFALQRSDVLPVGDLAAVSALRQLKKLPKETSKEELLKITDHWKPYRTIATMLLWHFYLSTRKSGKNKSMSI